MLAILFEMAEYVIVSLNTPNDLDVGLSTVILY